MSKFRIITVSALIMTVIGLHLGDLATGTEHWPISAYPMYSQLHDARMMKTVRLVGVTRDHREIAIDSVWVRKTFSLAANGPHSDKRVHKALCTFFYTYRRDLRQGKLAGRRPLIGVRLYEHRWQFAPSGAKSPEQVRIIGRYMRHPTKTRYVHS